MKYFSHPTPTILGILVWVRDCKPGKVQVRTANPCSLVNLGAASNHQELVLPFGPSRVSRLKLAKIWLSPVHQKTSVSLHRYNERWAKCSLGPRINSPLLQKKFKKIKIKKGSLKAGCGDQPTPLNWELCTVVYCCSFLPGCSSDVNHSEESSQGQNRMKRDFKYYVTKQ